MTKASAMPPPRAPGPGAGSSRLTLRRKGLALFVAISAYVASGAGFLAWQGLQSTGSAEISRRLEPILGAASVVILLGMVVFGAFLTLFLGRLAGDLGRLQARALEVANGLRAPPLALDRDDEVGTLARAVDKMAADLQAREAEIAAARLEQFHNERMLLLGGIAAGMAHEIGNPVAVIAAMASEVAEAQRAGRAPDCDTRELTRLAERLAAITRRLAVVAALRSRQQAALELNAVLESVTSLVAFDARFSPIEIVLDLDRSLPALVASEDDAVQLVMHLLVNAAEAFEGAGRARPRIFVSTSREGAHAVLEVADNARGMDAATSARALEPLFTTKPAGRGNGLGLDACRRILERYGGHITLDSTPGEGTRARCRFPLAAHSARVAL